MAMRGSRVREMTFELHDDRPRVDPIGFALRHPAVTVRVESLQVRRDAIWEVSRVTGPAPELAALVEALRRPPVHPLGEADVVSEDPRVLRWFLRWDRPKAGEAPSLFHLIFDVAGPDAVVLPRILQGRIEVRVACRSADDLRRLYAEVQRAYGAVRLVRVGPPRIGPEDVPDEDRELLAKAIAAGYYDEPKRVGVRELGEVLGWSKTVISRRLRALERRAVERFADSH